MPVPPALLHATELTEGAVDFSGLIRPHDRIVIGQGNAEPLSLTEPLLAQRQSLPGLALFLGVLFSKHFTAEACAGWRIGGYGGLGESRALSSAGLMEVWPTHYGLLPSLFELGHWPADVALIQLAQHPQTGALSFGSTYDYVPAAALKARMVIAEINANAPFTHGGELPDGFRIDCFLRSNRAQAAVPPARAGEIESRIGAHIAAHIPDGATIQMGIGALPDAVLAALKHHRELGVHSGMITEAVAELIERGAVTNARKAFDQGITIAGLLFGNDKLPRLAHDSKAFRLSPPGYTHGAAVLARIPNFMAINSAIEVDLTGQVNAERLGGKYIGAVGGQVDFTRGAAASVGGRSFVALPSTAGGKHTRIVASLGGAATSLRADADCVVTEHGVAELRGQSLTERARRMVAIADLAFREELARAAHDLLKDA